MFKKYQYYENVKTLGSSRKKRILFICAHNAGRSQIAEGVVNHLLGDRFYAKSGGTKPSSVNPYVIKAMAEVGIDISGHRSKNIKDLSEPEFDFVVTMCSEDDDICPFYPGEVHIHQAFDDPSRITGTDDEIMVGVRRIRDEIMAWIESEFNEGHAPQA